MRYRRQGKRVAEPRTDNDPYEMTRRSVGFFGSEQACCLHGDGRVTIYAVCKGSKFGFHPPPIRFRYADDD